VLKQTPARKGRRTHQEKEERFLNRTALVAVERNKVRKTERATSKGVHWIHAAYTHLFSATAKNKRVSDFQTNNLLACKKGFEAPPTFTFP
jgi:hypothetical protein